MARSNRLHSDHVNYLVLRYLQETGHGKAADAFSREWQRPREFREPEDFPFAHTVTHHELRFLVQDGLSYDELQARYPQNERRHRFTMAGSAGLSRASVEEDERENGIEGSRPPSSGKKRSMMKGPAGAAAAMRAPDEFPTPAPKRQRISHGSEGVHVNGDRDAMDVDAEGASVDDDDADADGEPASPTLASEDATDVPAERYDSMDVATQTNIRTGPKTTSLTLSISKPGASILHASFNPVHEAGKTGTLMAGGEDICRFYSIAEQLAGDQKQISYIDEPTLPPGAAVTSTSWHPKGYAVTCSTDGSRELTGDNSASMQLLMDITQDCGTVIYPPSTPLMDPPPMALTMQHNPSGSHLLVARSNVKRGAVQIWATLPDPENAHVRHESCGWEVFENQVHDATWTSDNEFIVCGEQGLSSLYSMIEPTDDVATKLTAGNITPRNLTQRASSLIPGTTKWQKVRYNMDLELAALASPEERKMAIVSIRDPSQITHVDIPHGLSALDFRPNNNDQSDKFQAILAAAFADGTSIIWTISNSEHGPTCEDLCTLDVSNDAALALSWSPDGKHLAVSSSDIVRVWRIDTENLDTHPLVKWQPPHPETNGVNGHSAVSELAQSEPSLSWSANGEQLGFAVDRQIAIITFRPPLTSTSGDGDTQMNGGASP